MMVLLLSTSYLPGLTWSMNCYEFAVLLLNCPIAFMHFQSIKSIFINLHYFFSIKLRTGFWGFGVMESQELDFFVIKWFFS